MLCITTKIFIFHGAKDVISIPNVKNYRSQTIIGVVAALLQTIVFDR
jgi:hypothetical protein